MSVNNQLIKNEKKIAFSQIIQSEPYQKLINNTLRDTKRANRFITSIISAVAINPLLQRCDANSILSSAFQGEALELSPSITLGEYYIIPYRVGKAHDNPEDDIYRAQFQLGVQGRLQLALRTNLYQDIDTLVIKEGEYKGKDNFTGQPIFEFIEDDEERDQKDIIGYMAYYILKNGFKKQKYISKNEAIKRANRSKAFNFEIYKKIQNGEELSWKEQQTASSPWFNWFDEMAQNAVLKDLLKRAPKSIELKIIEEEEDKEYKQDKENFTDIASTLNSSETLTSETLTPDEKKLIEEEFFNSTSVDLENDIPDNNIKKPTKKTTKKDI